MSPTLSYLNNKVSISNAKSTIDNFINEAPSITFTYAGTATDYKKIKERKNRPTNKRRTIRYEEVVSLEVNKVKDLKTRIKTEEIKFYTDRSKPLDIVDAKILTRLSVNFNYKVTEDVKSQIKTIEDQYLKECHARTKKIV